MKFTTNLPLDECRCRLRASKSTGFFSGTTEAKTTLKGNRTDFVVRRIHIDRRYKRRETVLQLTGILTPKKREQTEVVVRLEILSMGLAQIGFCLFVLALAILFFHDTYVKFLVFAAFCMAIPLAYDWYVLWQIIGKLKSP